MSADELVRLPKGFGQRYELVRGVLITLFPAGFEHGDIVLRLGARLRLFADANQLGRVVGAETGYRLASDPDTVRAPDISFVTRERIERARRVRGYFPGAPDLAVEVGSPGDTLTEVQEKVSNYFAAGARLVWIINPETRKVQVHHSASTAVTLDAGAHLDGGGLLPGFTCPVAELFE